MTSKLKCAKENVITPFLQRPLGQYGPHWPLTTIGGSSGVREHWGLGGHLVVTMPRSLLPFQS